MVQRVVPESAMPPVEMTTIACRNTEIEYMYRLTSRVSMRLWCSLNDEPEACRIYPAPSDFDPTPLVQRY